MPMSAGGFEVHGKGKYKIWYGGWIGVPLVDGLCSLNGCPNTEQMFSTMLYDGDTPRNDVCDAENVWIGNDAPGKVVVA